MCVVQTTRTVTADAVKAHRRVVVATLTRIATSIQTRKMI
jgi:hypothetical protein